LAQAQHAVNGAMQTMGISPGPKKREADESPAQGPPCKPRAGLDAAAEHNVVGMVEGLMSARDAKMIEMMRTVLAEQIQPIHTKVDAVQEQVQSMGTEVKQLEKRLAKLEKQPTPKYADGGRVKIASPCDENSGDIAKVAKALQLRLGVVVDTREAAAEAANAIFGQMDESLESLRAEVVDMYKPSHAVGTYITVSFDDPSTRKRVKWSMAKKVNDVWKDTCTYGDAPVKAFYPRTKFEKARDKKLYNARDMFAAQNKLDPKVDLKIDPTSRTVVKVAGGDVVARQCLSTWRVNFA